jgi:tetratricopeptide (TPR) repeat protein
MAQNRLLILGSLLPLSLAPACRGVPHGAECLSLAGAPLYAPAMNAERQAQLEADLLAARQAAIATPGRDNSIWVARRLGYLGRYREAIAVLDEALADHPDDPFVLRHRGHRWLTLREFGRAAWDLERAAQALRLHPDVIEPDGQPVEGRPPHSTLHFNVYYHLGLALFCAGDFELAERAWLRCLAVVGNDESRVAVTHWLWCVRMRLDDRGGAAALVATIGETMDVVENRAYHELCLLYAGKRKRAELQPRPGSAGSALAFGLAHHALVFGARTDARRQFEAIVQDAGWAAFGHIAAEVELARR